MPAHDARLFSYAVTAVIVAIVLALRVRGMRRARRLRIETLWVVPAIFGAVFAFAVFEAPPPDPLGWLWLALAGAAGSLVGWQRGRLMQIRVDPETHQINQQSSPAALLFIVLLIVARQGLRYEAAAYGINILKATGILMAFTFGLLTGARGEMYVRAKRLLVQARALRPA